jgi:hypothetical protein
VSRKAEQGLSGIVGTSRRVDDMRRVYKMVNMVQIVCGNGKMRHVETIPGIRGGKGE